MIKKKHKTKKTEKKKAHHKAKHHKGKKVKKLKVKVKWVLPTIIILGIILIAVIIGSLMNSSKALAVVNGERITEKDVNDLYELTPPAMKPVIDKDQLLDQLVEWTLVLQEAKKAGVRKSSSDAEEFIVVQLSQSGTTLEIFKESLEAQGLDYNTMKEVYRKQLIMNDFLNITLGLGAEVTDEEISSFYYEHLNELSQEESIRASHILLETKEEAEDVRTKALNGEDFAELAREYSTGPSGPIGGDLNFFSRGAMVPEFEQAAFAMGVGEISEVVQTQFGYHVIKVTDKINAGTPPLSEIKDSVKTIVVQEKQTGLIDDYVSKLKEDANIIFK